MRKSLRKKHRNMAVRLDTIPMDKQQNKRELFVGSCGSPYNQRGVRRMRAHTIYNDRRDCSKKKKKRYFISVIEKHYCIGMCSLELLEPGSYKRKCRHSCTVCVEWTLGQISTQKVFLNRIMFYNIYVSTHTEGT